MRGGLRLRFRLLDAGQQYVAGDGGNFPPIFQQSQAGLGVSEGCFQIVPFIIDAAQANV